MITITPHSLDTPEDRNYTIMCIDMIKLRNNVGDLKWFPEDSPRESVRRGREERFTRKMFHDDASHLHSFQSLTTNSWIQLDNKPLKNRNGSTRQCGGKYESVGKPKKATIKTKEKRTKTSRNNLRKRVWNGRRKRNGIICHRLNSISPR